MLDERSVIGRHRCHMAATCKFGVFVDEDHSKLPTLYWLPNFHKKKHISHVLLLTLAYVLLLRC